MYSLNTQLEILDIVKKLNFPLIKISSGLMTNLPLVEEVAKFLSNQSVPEYDETITEEPENTNDFDISGFNTNNNQQDELYNQAVALIAREKRASTSFIQRHFKIGYNRAATIIEKMEENNVVSKPGRAGKREVLIEDH